MKLEKTIKNLSMIFLFAMIFSCQLEEDIDPFQIPQEFSQYSFEEYGIKPLWSNAIVNSNSIEVPFMRDGRLARHKYNLENEDVIQAREILYIPRNSSAPLKVSQLLKYIPRTGYNNDLSKLTLENYAKENFEGRILSAPLDRGITEWRVLDINKQKGVLQGLAQILDEKSAKKAPQELSARGCDFSGCYVTYYYSQTTDWYQYNGSEFQYLDNTTQYWSETYYVPYDGNGGYGSYSDFDWGQYGLTSTAPILIFNNLNGKAKCLYEKLRMGSSTFRNAIQKFDGDFPVAHLTLAINNSLSLGRIGQTMPPSNYNVTIEISNTELGKISDLGGVVAFAHEIIHAEIFRKMLSAAQKGDLNHNLYTTQERVNYINSLRNNFPGLYDYYFKEYKPTWNHNMMANHYRNVIADIVSQFDSNRLSRQIYEDISWAGLRVIEGNNISNAWSNLSQTEKNRILSNFQKYFFNGTSSCN